MKHWAQVQESTFLGGMSVLLWIYRLTGRTVFRLCALPVVTWYWVVAPRARDASAQFLSRVAAACGRRRPGAFATLRHQLSFAESILDKVLAFSGEYPADRISMDGAEPLRELLRRGEGALLLTAHLGCLELCQANADRLDGPRLTVLVHTRHAERFNALLARLRPASTVRLLQVSEITPATAQLLADRIQAGELVAMAADRVPLYPTVSNTVEVDFLGHQARFPAGPYVLAMLLKCPVYYMSCRRNGRGYRVHFEPLADRVTLPRAARREALAGYAAGFVKALERDAVESPYDWFNFHSVWAALPAATAAEQQR